ncbi:hypothetical protein MMYC01_203841 [Madurella mycetomatis]|uniref:Uncharacterized protein n=1 Tax=Madurella mycetomatis TaxID=100816 RepID=A0A175WAG4_9PEZI|nr:hypothetical protein MMYC01_203841 [Madurella mycetomatis]
MAKRPFDVSDPASSPPKRAHTQRTHDENRERAYIAASRRTDRTLEDRMDSAYKASAMHKRRTGKGFKLSEEIVKNQEMYEEDDDELPRRSFAIPPHVPVLTNPSVKDTAAAKLAEQAEVERIFDQQFPGYSACLRSRRFSQPLLFSAAQSNWVAHQFQPAPVLQSAPATQCSPVTTSYPSNSLPSVAVDDPISPALNSSPEPDSPYTPPPPAHSQPCRPHPISTAIPLQTYTLESPRSQHDRKSISPTPADQVSLRNIDPSLIGLSESLVDFPAMASGDYNLSSFVPAYHHSAFAAAITADHWLAVEELPLSAITTTSSSMDTNSAASEFDLSRSPITPVTPLSDGGNQSHQAVVEDESWKDFLELEGDCV